MVRFRTTQLSNPSHSPAKLPIQPCPSNALDLRRGSTTLTIRTTVSVRGTSLELFFYYYLN